MITRQEHKQSPRKKSFFSIENKKTDESKGITIQQDLQVDRSCQRQLFEFRFKEMDEGLQGDQPLSDNSLFGGNINQSCQDLQFNSTILQSNVLINKISENKRYHQTEGNEEQEQEEGNELVKMEDRIIIIEEKYESKHSPKKNEQTNIKQDLSDVSLIVQSTTNIKNGNSALNPESMSKGDSGISIQKKIKSQNNKQQQQQQILLGHQIQQPSNIDLNQNSKGNINFGWMPEQVIYEKDQNQIKRMVTKAILDKSHNNIQSNSQQRKSQQNFERAKNIINKLLNNSMSRMMRVRQHVHNFVYLLKLKYINRKSNQLTHNDYLAINDLSIYYKIKQKQKTFNFFILQLQNILKFTQKIPIFMPTDSLRVVWDLFQVFFTYIFLYIYSILMFYAQDERDSSFIQKFFYYAFFLFIIDILINFNTAYFDKDIIINKRKQIAKQYILSTLFLTDCVSLMVIGIKVISQSTSIVYNPNHNMETYFLNILIFLKANGMQPKKKRFDYVFTLKENQKHVVKLINQLFSVVTVAHIASIGWYFIGVQENINSYSISWLQKQNLSSSTYQEKYIYSIYWAITTMTTVGYGDIAATNQVEALFISIIMILFSCVFAYSINNIGFILQEIEKSSKQLNDNITTIQRYINIFFQKNWICQGIEQTIQQQKNTFLLQLNTLKHQFLEILTSVYIEKKGIQFLTFDNRYLNRKNVNISLKSRVRHYLSFLAQEQKDRDKEAEDQILSILSNKLRDEITIEINTRILSQYHVFSSNFSRQTLNKIVFKMTEVLVSPNEVIFQDGQIDDQSIYFIQSGIIEIYQQQVQKQNKINVIQTLNVNQLFGEIAFFSGLSRSASARSVNLSTLYKIKRDDFIDVLKENDEDFERFKMIQEQIIFQEEVHQLFVECYTCKQLGHLSKSCPRTHQSFDKQFIILKDNFSFFQERLKDSRNKNREKISFYKFLKHNKDICSRIKENLQNLNTEIFIMFDTNQSMNGEDYTSDEEEDEEEDYDDDDGQSSDEQTQKSSNQAQSDKSSIRQKSSKKNSYQKKKSSKMFKKELSKRQSHETFDQCSTNQDIQSKNLIINNIVIDKDEIKQNYRQKVNSFKKTKSNDSSEDGISNNVQCDYSSNQINYIYGDLLNTSHNYNQNLNQKSKDYESMNSNISEILQQQETSDLEKKNAQKNREKSNSKYKENTGQQSYKQISETIIDTSPKNQIFQQHGQNHNNNQNNMYAYAINKCTSKQIDDFNSNNLNTLKSNNGDPSTPKSIKGKRKSSIPKNQSAKSLHTSKKMLSQNNNNANPDYQNNYRYSIDNMLIMQGLINQSIISATRQSIKDQRLSKKYQGSSKLAEIKEIPSKKQISKKDSSNQDSQLMVDTQDNSLQQIKEVDQRSFKNLQNLLNQANQLQTNSSKKLINLSPNLEPTENLVTSNPNQLQVQSQLVERFSHLLMSNQLPLLLQQYSVGMSFREMQSMNPQLSMDQFDKMQNFKKFFPHNNFDKVVNKIKSKLIEQKKLKKQKIQQKSRRQNILVHNLQTRVSVYHGDSGFLRFMAQEYNPDLYKPTYLSYGVGMKKGVYPINNFYLNGFY